MPIHSLWPMELTISEFHARLKAGEFNCVQLVQAYLGRIERYDRRGPTLQAIVNVNPQALAQARELDEQFAATGSLQGLLHGVPLLVKDQGETDFVPTTFGSRAYLNYQPLANAFVIEKLIAAGALVLAKTSMCDFAAGWFSFSSVTERTRNPYALDRDAGGSSAGTAAGLAANFGLAGVGEDTGGSIRLPASFNNIYGLRVTTGLISRTGFSPLLHEQDTPGPMARTVRDIAKMLDVMVGYDKDDPATLPTAQGVAAGRYEDSLKNARINGIRIGLAQECFGIDGPSTAAVNTVVHQLLERLREAGAQIVEVHIPSLEDWISRTSLYAHRSRTDLDLFMASRSGVPAHSFDEIYRSGCFHPQNDLFHTLAAGPTDPGEKAYKRRRLAQAEFQKLLLDIYAAHELDFLMYPDVRVLPPTYAELESGQWSCLSFPTNTVIASQAHLPALSMPAGFSAGNIPVGVEVVGKPYAEAALLRFAHACEQLTRPRLAPAL